MKRIVILLGMFAMLFGAMIILPALGTHQKHPEAWTSGEITGLLLGIIVALAGAIAVFCGTTMSAQSKKAFTLVEIMMAIAIVGVLAAVLLPLI
jgi:prepilin-type N-terminal cleavage/methylation domain-containing protein